MVVVGMVVVGRVGGGRVVGGAGIEAGPFEVRREGVDKYGRTLALIVRDGLSVGCELVREGLARPWIGPAGPRC